MTTQDRSMNQPGRSARTPVVVVTREDPAPVCEAVRAVGGEPVELELLVTRWLRFELPKARGLDDYAWVAFTSARAVDAIARRAVHDGWNWPPQARAAAVGDRTAHELQARSWMPECVSSGTGARGLVDAMRTQVKAGARVLFPCSTLADSTLPNGLRRLGAAVDVVHVYSTETTWQRDPSRKAPLATRFARALRAGCVPTCASPSAVRALVEVALAAGVAERLHATPVVVLGPTTAATARALNLNPIEAGGKSLSDMARTAVEAARAL